jgi:hypothetical protein
VRLLTRSAYAQDIKTLAQQELFAHCCATDARR